MVEIADMITQPRESVEARFELAWLGEPWFRLIAAARRTIINTD
jgi:hypothetical protein